MYFLRIKIARQTQGNHIITTQIFTIHFLLSLLKNPPPCQRPPRQGIELKLATLQGYKQVLLLINKALLISCEG